MFQNPLKSQGLDKSDPFSSLDSNGQSEFSLDCNPFTTSGGSTWEQGINPNQHFVEPHYVQGYERADGVQVDGYWRDGDGDTTQDLTLDNGGGYVQTNPDGNPFNNFG